MVRDECCTGRQKTEVYGNSFRHRFNDFRKDFPQGFFQGRVAVLFKQMIKEGKRKELALAQYYAFNEKVLFGVVKSAVCGVVFYWRTVPIPQVFNITQDGTLGNLRFFSKAMGVWKGAGPDCLVNEENALDSDFFFGSGHGMSILNYTQ
jgi:hypothetical protein